MRPKILVITGPTATGKTALGISMALALDGEVVSADSMQVYRRMDIGTAKPAPAEMRGVTHHMLDVAEPTERFSAARYVELAVPCVDGILSRGRLPIIVGGTGLYIDSLIAGRDFADSTGDGALRGELSREYDALGGEELLKRLSLVDPERAEKLAPGDKKRIVRALEVFALTGETITEHDEKERALPPRYDAVRIVLSFADRQRLYARIDSRVDLMLEAGLVREVKALLDEGVPPDSTAMQAIGYKEIAAALRGETDLDAAAETVKLRSRRYAKRQLTWFRRYTDALWIEWEKTPDEDFARRRSTDFLHSHGIEW